MKKHKTFFCTLIILCLVGVFATIWSELFVEDSKIIELSPAEAVHIAQDELVEQGFDGYITPKLSSPVLLADSRATQFFAEVFDGDEDKYYSEFSFPYFTYAVTLKHLTAPSVKILVDAKSGKVVEWKFEEESSLTKNNPHYFSEPKSNVAHSYEESFNKAVNLLKTKGVNFEDVVLESEEINPETGKIKFRFENEKSEVESDYGQGSIVYDIEITEGVVNRFSTTMNLPASFSNSFDEYRSNSARISSVWFWLNIIIFIVALFVLYKNRSLALHYRDKLLISSGVTLMLLVFFEAFNGLPSILHILDDYTLFSILFNYLVSIISLAVVFILPGLVFLLAGSVLYEQVMNERFSLFKGSRNKNGNLLTGTIYGYFVAGIIGVFIVITSFFGSDNALPEDSLADLEYLVSSFVPSFSVFFTIALIPAIFEEITFRLFTFVLLLRTTRSYFLSIVVTTSLWVLPHIGLVGEIDVFKVMYFTLTGLLLMFTFLRYGLYTGIIAHFLVNATLGMILLNAFFGYSITNVLFYLIVILVPVFLYMYKTYVNDNK